MCAVEQAVRLIAARELLFRPEQLKHYRKEEEASPWLIEKAFFCQF
jgi:hypothetical protein